MIMDICYIWIIWLVLRLPTFELKESIQCEIFESAYKAHIYTDKSITHQILKDVPHTPFCKFDPKKKSSCKPDGEEDKASRLSQEYYYSYLSALTNVQEPPPSFDACLVLQEEKYHFSALLCRRTQLLLLEWLSPEKYAHALRLELREREADNLKFDLHYLNSSAFALLLNNKLHVRRNLLDHIYKIKNVDFVRMSPDGLQIYAQRDSQVFYVRLNPPSSQLIELQEMSTSAPFGGVLTFEPVVFMERPCLLMVTTGGEVLHVFVEVDQVFWKALNGYEAAGIMVLVLCLISIKLNYF